MSASISEIPIYQQLLQSGSDEIRLVTIESSTDSLQGISCTIETVELSTSPEYLALSYVWGNANITEEIKLRGYSVQVTTNLAAAMRRLRGWKKRNKFWIDSICINQSSVAEKNHQVPLMGKIYSQARGVVIWLGEAKEDSKLAIALVKRWGEGIAAAMAKCPEKYHTSPLKTALSFIENPFDEQSFQAVNFLLKRYYWSRVWIIQEIVLARSRLILCGGDSTDYNNLYFALTFWTDMTTMSKLNDSQIIGFDLATSISDQLGNPSIGDLRRLIMERSHARTHGQPYKADILSLIHTSAGCFCSDPRDRLYGLFGLIDDQKLPMRPDYHLGLEELNMAFIVGLVQTSRKLDAVSLAGFRPEIPEESNFSTWVPEYTRRSSERADMAVLPSVNYRAAADSKADCVFQGSYLHARGIVCSEILDICDPGSDNILEDEKQEWVWKWLALAKPQSDETYHPAGIPWRQAFFRTLVGDTSGLGFGRAEFCSEETESRFYGRAEGFMTFMRSYALEIASPFVDREVTKEIKQEGSFQISLSADVLTLLDIRKLVDDLQIGDEVAHWLANSSTTGDETTRDHLLKKFCGKVNDPNALTWPQGKYACEAKTINFRGFLAALRLVTAGRSFFVTPEGYMGLGPRFAEKGDLVCILLGCSVPILIRKREAKYAVVGDTYIYGMMHGEIMEKVDRGRLSVQDLTFQ